MSDYPLRVTFPWDLRVHAAPADPENQQTACAEEPCTTSGTTYLRRNTNITCIGCIRHIVHMGGTTQ